MPARILQSSELSRPCPAEQFAFRSTDELEPLAGLIAQPRAVAAVEFGVDIQRDGYHIFAFGPPGTGKRTFVRQFLEARAAREPAPDDWCYVNNFEQPHRPRALRLPAGRARAFREDMERLVEEVGRALPAAFEAEDYRRQRRLLQEQLEAVQKQAFEKLQREAHARQIEVAQTPVGVAFAPTRQGALLSSEEAQKLSEQERREIESRMEELERRAQQIFEEAPRAQRTVQKQIDELKRRTAERAIESLLAELRAKYADLPPVVEYLEAVKADLVRNRAELLRLQRQQKEGEEATPRAPLPSVVTEPAVLRAYRVNVLVDHDPRGGAPVIYEDDPNYERVIGRVEHLAHLGALLSDFNLIKPGALHRANGGYLILEAAKLLLYPFLWDALKHALRAREVRIESPWQAIGLISTVSLEPEPIPLRLKVVLLGSPLLYYLLSQFDADFCELFKVAAEFAELMDRTPENEHTYVRLIATLCRKEGLRRFDRAAVARVIEYGSRLAGDQQKLSAEMRSVADVLREADYWAGRNGRPDVTPADVERAIETRLYRSDRIRELIQEAIRRGTLLIDTDGAVVGQVNGLAVVPFGEFLFGKPTRITARTALGAGEVIDIEREVKLGGATHSKGVLILAGFFAGRYARDVPLSLSASLVFEQSYSDVAGDSASLAELCALLSAIADAPIQQALAVTGSVNQHGRVQAIGGVNEKIEGFFDTCRIAGLSGRQGVIIPNANVQHLMLRRDVIEAVAAGRFRAYAVETVDQAIELLTGLPAGEPDAAGRYPPESLNGRVQSRLEELARKRQQYLPAPPAAAARRNAAE